MSLKLCKNGVMIFRTVSLEVRNSEADLLTYKVTSERFLLGEIRCGYPNSTLSPAFYVDEDHITGLGDGIGTDFLLQIAHVMHVITHSSQSWLASFGEIAQRQDLERC